MVLLVCTSMSMLDMHLILIGTMIFLTMTNANKFALAFVFELIAVATGNRQCRFVAISFAIPLPTSFEFA